MQQAGKSEKMTGNLANIVSYDVDINAAAAMFDPQKANDDRYYRAYRQISAGPYTVTSGARPEYAHRRPSRSMRSGSSRRGCNCRRCWR